MRIIAQLSWPVPPESWLADHQFGWTHALIPFAAAGHEVIFMGQAASQKETADKGIIELWKHGCRVVLLPEEQHQAFIREQHPGMVFFNDFPEVYWSWVKELRDNGTLLVMRMHGDWPRFTRWMTTLAQADLVVSPLIADAVCLRAFGVNCPVVHVPFGVQLEDLIQARKPWEKREIDFGCTATTPLKGYGLMEPLFLCLRAHGYRCETVAWMDRPTMCATMGNVKVMFCPSANEGWSRVATESAVARCRIVVSAESTSMVEQAGHLEGFAVRTGLVTDLWNQRWDHKRPVPEIANDLIGVLNSKRLEFCSEFMVSIERENDLLTKALQRALR